MPVLNRSLAEKVNCVNEILSGVNPKYKYIHSRVKWLSNRIVKHIKDDRLFTTLVYLGEYNYLGFYSIYYKETLNEAIKNEDHNKIAKLINHPLIVEAKTLENRNEILEVEKIALNLFLERRSLSIDDRRTTLKSCRKEVYKIRDVNSKYLHFPMKEKIFVDGKTRIEDIRDFIYTAANHQMTDKLRNKVKQIHMDELKMMMKYKRVKEENEGVLWSSTPEKIE